jgi:hypothetical protein
MKVLKIVLLLSFLYVSGCKKDHFDIKNPDVKTFVQQLKDGTYDRFEFGENRERLWAKMPEFNITHLSDLINMAKDTSLVCPADHFPVNPVSSIPPYRIYDQKTCVMMGEYLLWCADAVITKQHFTSLTPRLVNTEKQQQERLSGKEILEVRNLYRLWLEKQNETGNSEKFPLEKTDYVWM